MTASARGRSSEVVEQRRRLVDHLQGVGPHVALGMPVGILGRPSSGSSSGATPASMPHSWSSARPSDGRRAFSSSFSISPKTRSAGSSASGIEAHSARGGGVDASSKRAASWTARSARSGSSPKVERVHRTQDARLEVAPAAAGVEDLARRGIEEHRVDREVAPTRRLHVESRGRPRPRCPRWPGPDLRVAPGQRDVHGPRDAVQPAHLVDA